MRQETTPPRTPSSSATPPRRASPSSHHRRRGQYKISTGIRFFDHMLELFTRHGAFDLELKCDGDLDVDQHHTVEDVGIALGEAFDRALGDKRGILRAGYFLMPMDETLAIAAVDLSGRAAFAVEPRCARAWWAICKPSWSPISSRASRAARAPTFT
jgi:imidazoleglycerol phosphate dehydratase HisB